MSLSASDVVRACGAADGWTQRARPAGKRGALGRWSMRAVLASACVAAGVLPTPAAFAQAASDSWITIPGPGQPRPAAPMPAQRSGAQGGAPLAQAAGAAPVQAPASQGASDAEDFSNAAAARGAIVIPGPAERTPTSTPTSASSAAQAMPRANAALATRHVIPVVVASASAPDALRQPAQRVAMNAPVAPARAAGQPAHDAPGAATPATAATAAIPAGQQDGESIRQAALAYLQQQVQGLPGKVSITVNPVFPHGLAACASLAPFMPTGSRMWGRMTVGVRCVGEHPWTLYVQAHVSVRATYYVAAREITPGDTLSAADLAARNGDLTILPQAIITEVSQAVGASALTRVPQGVPLRRDMLKSASAVTVGQTVRIVAIGQGFSISSEGSVMNNAAPGQSVRVKTAAGQIIQGIVKDGGTVEIQL